jgi:hypothetical protein
MLLTITSTHPPATDLGYLLHKNPARAQSFGLPFGAAHVFYPEASSERCTAALLLKGATMPNGQKYEDWLKSKGSGEDRENTGTS